ncbi:MAG TPA: CARDB domain-containing protein [Gemmataceae bacterium]|jgi:uncharacterized repeat protein (TIGR01451 family)|nr:CARDB domain-containing protein [Gemmataceae bacterium]
MRRIHIAMMALGLVGVLGITLVQATAQPAPSPYSGRKDAEAKPKEGPSIPLIPPAAPGGDIVLPPLPSGPEINLPPLITDVGAPASDVKPMIPAAAADVKPMLPIAPTVEVKPPVAPPPVIKNGNTPEVRKPEPPKPEPAKPVFAEAPPVAAPPAPPTITPATPIVTAPSRVMPGVTLETIVPDAVQLGKDISYEIVIKNTGSSAVMGVKVEEELPTGARYLGGEPMAEALTNTLTWSLGELVAGAEKHLKINVKPAGESDYKTSPKITYSATAANTVKVTRPKLSATVTGPETVLINEEAAFTIQVKNEGTGAASKVKIHVALPNGLKHPQQREGSPVEAELPTLAAGETKSVVLKTKALEAGAQTCELTVMAESCGAVTSKAITTVQKPMLEARLVSPGKAMVRGEPTFTLEVNNPGNAATPNVQAAVSFAQGLDFVSASESGNYEPGSRTITWNIGAVPAGGKKALTFKLRAGVHGKIEVNAVAASPAKVDDKQLMVRSSAQLEVEGVPAVGFEVVNVENPCEVGKEVTYEIRILNQGTRPLTNVKLAAAMSEGLTVTSVTGPAKHTQSGQTLGFEAIPRLAVKADMVIRVKAKGTTAGDLRCKVQLLCDQLKQPVVKEESTVFFMP